MGEVCVTVWQVPGFGTNLRNLRKARGLRAKELAALLDVKPTVVSRWENERRGLPETPTLLRLAKALSVSVDELLRGVDTEYDADNVARSQSLNRSLQELRDFFQGRPPAELIEELSREELQRLLMLVVDINFLAPMTAHLWRDVSGSDTEKNLERRDLLRHDRDQASDLSAGRVTDASSGVKHDLPGREGLDAVAAANGTPARTLDRVQKPEAAVDAEVQRGITRERNRIERELIESLYNSADHLRAVADTLLGATRPPAPRTASAAHAGGRAPLRRAAARRRGRS